MTARTFVTFRAECDCGWVEDFGGDIDTVPEQCPDCGEVIDGE